MKKSVKYISLLLVFSLMSGMCACSKSTEETTSSKKKKKKATTTTTVEETTIDPIEEELETAVPAESFEDINLETDLKVTVDIDGSLGIEPGTELTVTQMEEEVIEEMGAHCTAYDITLGDYHELDGFVDVRIPYDPANIPEGQDPAKCVGAMYLNEETSEWEPVLFEVDAEKQELVIYTDHFSTYGCFEFKNEGMRNCYVSAINDYMVDKETDVKEYLEAVKEIVDNEGIPGQKCKELMRPYLEQTFNSFAEMNLQTGSTTTYITNLTTLFITGSGLDTKIANNELTNGMNTALGKAGMAVSILSLATMALKENKTDNEILSMYKDAVYLLASLTGEATLGTIAASVWCIDYTITEMGNYVYNKVKENLTRAYRYYMTTNNNWHGKPRTLKDWRKILKQVAKDATLNRDSAEEAIMDEIDRYCNEFWTIPDDQLAEIYDQVDSGGYGIPDAATKKAITDEFKGELLDSLQAVFGAVQRDLEFELWEEQQKRIENIRKILNTRITVDINEVRPNDRPSHYAGYTAVFSKLNEAAVTDDWKIVLDSNGGAQFPVIFIAYLLVGAPEEIWVYSPGQKIGEEEPELKVELNLIAPKTNVPLELVVKEVCETGIVAAHMDDGASIWWYSKGARVYDQNSQAQSDSYKYYMTLKGEILVGVPLTLLCSGDPGTIYIDGYSADANGTQTPFSYSADGNINQEIIFPSGAKTAVVNVHCHTACITLTLDIVGKYSTTGSV